MAKKQTRRMERLQRASDRINATDLGDGMWAYWADEVDRYCVVDADDLEELCDYLDADDEQVRDDAFSHWCAGTLADEMPRGWEPGGDSDSDSRR